MFSPAAAKDFGARPTSLRRAHDAVPRDRPHLLAQLLRGPRARLLALHQDRGQSQDNNNNKTKHWKPEAKDF